MHSACVPVLTYRLKGKLWLYGGAAGWHFITLPKKQAREIRLLMGGVTGRGWGSLKVKATIGSTTWPTSIFPSKEHGSMVLPVKAEVRKAEGLEEGRDVEYVLELG